jgi:glycosyltransferase involved in cell wall biosynthesis
MLQASVIICTHNPRPHYLHRVLEALRNQTLSLENWELLLIDNGSKEPLTSKVWDMSWHLHARYVREDQLGLTSARLRGMREALADMLIFVDDDNVLDTNYLEEAIQIKRAWPLLGVWGSGTTIPEFEVQPASHLREFMDLLALRNVSRPQWSNVIPCAGARPWGAGQCVRRSVANAYGKHIESTTIKMADRKGSMLSSGGDVEISFVACSMGLGVGIFPELKLTHVIPRERVKEDYLTKLAEGIMASAILLEYKWENNYPKSPFASPLGWARVVKNLLYRKGIHRRMYVAGLRATLRARAIILASKDNSCPGNNLRRPWGKRIGEPS